jgi:hypothetical protein
MLKESCLIESAFYMTNFSKSRAAPIESSVLRVWIPLQLQSYKLKQLLEYYRKMQADCTIATNNKYVITIL